MKVVSPDFFLIFFLRFMIFPTFLEISGGGGGQKEKCFFLVNQLFLIMLSLRFMLFSTTTKIPGGGVVSGSALRTVTILLTVSTVVYRRKYRH